MRSGRLSKEKRDDTVTLNLPYVVAVNALEEHADTDSAADALFGTEAVEIRRNQQGFHHRNIRNRDGVWYGRRGPTYTRVSAVISTERLSWNLRQRRARLFLNPWARHPMPIIPIGIDINQVVDERLQLTQGNSIGEILGLPEAWPE
jgi:hypothetical protein